MGTSSSYGGNKDKKNLLPEDYDENSNQQISWQSVKTGLSKYINGSGGNGIKGTARQYVKAAGGAASLTARSTSGISGAVNIGNMFSSIRENGVIETFERFGIEYTGKSVEEICSSLINYIAPDSNSKEDGVAREAATEAMTHLYQYIDNNDMEIETLDSMPEELIEETFCCYIENYIWGKILNDLEFCFEKNSNDPQKTVMMEQELKLYISNTVSVAFNSPEIKEKIFGNQSIENGVKVLYKDCYEEMEAYKNDFSM
jgi:hypothetical protein